MRRGKTELRYQLRAIEDLHKMLKANGGWVPLGSADEQKPAAEGTVEAWGRSVKNPVGGWNGLMKGYPGPFGLFLAPLPVALCPPEAEQNAQKNPKRATQKGCLLR